MLRRYERIIKAILLLAGLGLLFTVISNKSNRDFIHDVMQTYQRANIDTKTTETKMSSAGATEKKVEDLHFKKGRLVHDVDCLKLFLNDPKEKEIAHILENEHTAKWTRRNDSQFFSHLVDNTSCQKFKQEQRYITHHLTATEKNFPLAYSILMYKQPDQVEMLLRAIYRPQNYYCIHIDQKADEALFKDMSHLADCFDNVFIASRSVNVTWGTFTVLEPELVCLQDLWRYKKWKYFINLTGQEYPLKTNYELVKILRTMEGANLVSVCKQIPRWEGWWRDVGPPPHGIHPYKGSVHAMINRAFVDYILHSQIARDVIDWTRKIKHGSVFFFNTLNHNPQLGIPGSYGEFRHYQFHAPITRTPLDVDCIHSHDRSSVSTQGSDDVVSAFLLQKQKIIGSITASKKIYIE
ncbi:hypothetical protein ScPMuIL_016822 [Solemya velum]